VAAFISGRLQRDRGDVGGSVDVVVDQSSSSAVSINCLLVQTLAQPILIVLYAAVAPLISKANPTFSNCSNTFWE